MKGRALARPSERSERFERIVGITGCVTRVCFVLGFIPLSVSLFVVDVRFCIGTRSDLLGPASM